MKMEAAHNLGESSTGALLDFEIDGFKPYKFGKLRVNFQSIQQNW